MWSAPRSNSEHHLPSSAEPSLALDPTHRKAPLGGRGYVHWVSNIVVLLLVLGGVWFARAVSRSRFWRESAVELWRRRSAAIVVVVTFVLIALLDSIAWIGGGGEGVSGRVGVGGLACSMRVARVGPTGPGAAPAFIRLMSASPCSLVTIPL